MSKSFNINQQYQAQSYPQSQPQQGTQPRPVPSQGYQGHPQQPQGPRYQQFQQNVCLFIYTSKENVSFLIILGSSFKLKLLNKYQQEFSNAFNLCKTIKLLCSVLQ